MAETSPSQAILVTCLFISLLFPDSWILGNPDNSSDIIKDIILVIVMTIFMLEMIVYSYCQDTYPFSFYFFLDFIGTFSMILDITFISENFGSSSSDSRNASFLRAVRAAKLGARYARLMRFMKLFKYIRYLPCLKQTTDQEPAINSVKKVINNLTDLLIRGVAINTLFLVIVVPFITYPVQDYSIDSCVDILSSIAFNNSDSVYDLSSNFMFQSEYFEKFFKNKTPLIRVYVKSQYLFNFNETYTVKISDEMIRDENIISYSKESYNNEMIATFNYTSQSWWDSFCGLWIILLVIIIFVVYSLAFQKLVENKVNAPLEKSIKSLRNCATTILKSLQAMEVDKKQQMKMDTINEDDTEEEEDENFESAVLEKIVEKCKYLLLSYYIIF